MTPKLRALVVVIGTLTIGGSIAILTAPSEGVTLLQLRDGGMFEGQAFVLECPERLSEKQRLKQLDAGRLRPHQRYARIARMAMCLRTDGGSGNCFNADGGMLVNALGATIIVPSLRKPGRVAIDDEADDSVPLARECESRRCGEFDAGFCSTPFQVAVVPSRCVIPDCRNSDGGWDDRHAPVDCLGPVDGGQGWRGCETMPASSATGTACLRVECGVLQGERIEDDL